MYVLNKCTWGDFDIGQTEAVAVSENKAVLETEAARLNAKRNKEDDFEYGEWKLEYKVAPGKVRVL